MALADGAVVFGKSAHEVIFAHYDVWRTHRFNVLLDALPELRTGQTRSWSILEAGGGHCWFSEQLSRAGHSVTCSEGRAEHTQWVKRHLPHIPVRQDDWDKLADDVPVYDLLIHYGLLYHLKDSAKALQTAMAHANVLALETEVVDSHDANLVCSRWESGGTQALNNYGSRPSPAFVERVLLEGGFFFVRLDTPRLNALGNVHRYDWPIRGTGVWAPGLRKSWIAWRPSSCPWHRGARHNRSADNSRCHDRLPAYVEALHANYTNDIRAEALTGLRQCTECASAEGLFAGKCK